MLFRFDVQFCQNPHTPAQCKSYLPLPPLFPDDSSLEPDSSRLSVKDTSDTASITSKKHRTLSRAIASKTSKLIKTLPRTSVLGKHHKKSHGTSPSSLDTTGEKSLTGDKSITSIGESSLTSGQSSLNSTAEGPNSASSSSLNVTKERDSGNEDALSVTSTSPAKKSKTLKRKILNKIQKMWKRIIIIVP